LQREHESYEQRYVTWEATDQEIHQSYYRASRSQTFSLYIYYMQT